MIYVPIYINNICAYIILIIYVPTLLPIDAERFYRNNRT